MRTITRSAAVAATIATAIVLASCSAGAEEAPPTVDSGSIDLSAQQVSPEAQEAAVALYDQAIADGENSVTLYTATASEELAPVFESFEKLFPGIKVEQHTLIGPELSAALQAEAGSGNHVVDLLQNSNYKAYTEFVKIEPYEVVSYETPQSLAEFDEVLAPSDHEYTTPYVNPVGIGINTDMISAEDLPDTWDGLAAAEWNGKIAFHNPTVPGLAAEVFPRLEIMGALDEASIQGLADNGEIKGDYPQITQGLAQGQYPVMLVMPSSNAVAMQQAGATIEYVTMPGANVVLPQKWLLVGDAPRPAAAKLFLEYLNFFDAQKAIAVKGNTPLNSAAADPEKPFTNIDDLGITSIPSDAEVTQVRETLTPVLKQIFQER